MTLRDLYPLYLERGGKLDKKTFLEINGKVMKAIADRVVEGKDVILPYQIGTLHIMGRKMPIKQSLEENVHHGNVNWPKTRKLWKDSPELVGKKFILHMNEHTNLYYYKWKWTKKGMNLYYKEMYGFRPTSTNKSNLSKAIRNGQEYQHDPYQKI